MGPPLAMPPGAPTLSILMYHQIGRYPRPDAHRALFCHIDRFRSQLAYLDRAGFDVLSMDQAVDSLFGRRPLTRRSVVITVDDGYDDFREHAWPALKERGFPAMVYLVGSLIGQRSSWQTHRPDPAPLMTADAVRALHRDGCHFGSHTLSHPRLSHLPAAEQRREIADSKHLLEDLLGAEVPHFCYPYGDYTARSREFVAEAGYRSATTCIRGAGNLSEHPLELTRKAISYGDNLLGFAWKLHFKQARKGKGALADRVS